MLVYITFLLSAALASAGIVYSTKLRNIYKTAPFSALFYFQVFIYTFGFYGIWGQVLLKAVLEGSAPAEMISRFSNISLLLGIPFLIFAWLMLIRFAREISGRERNNSFAVWFLAVNFIVLFSLGYLLTKSGENKPDVIIRYYFISMNMIYSLISAAYIIFQGHHKGMLHKYEGRIFSYGLLLFTALDCILLAFYEFIPPAGLIFIFVFFAGNCLIPVYLNYGTTLSIFLMEPNGNLSYDHFCKSFEITQRESEIIREICNGLSNKEIADKLFITLQTVKDHTHRIYSKTNVRSRVQLMNLVKESRK